MQNRGLFTELLRNTQINGFPANIDLYNYLIYVFFNPIIPKARVSRRFFFLWRGLTQACLTHGSRVDITLLCPRVGKTAAPTAKRVGKICPPCRLLLDIRHAVHAFPAQTSPGGKNGARQIRASAPAHCC